MRPTARNSAAARCPLLWHRHVHRDHGLAVLEVGHDGGQIGAADQGEQPLLVVAEAGDARLEVVHDIDVGHDGMVRHAFERLVAEVPGLAAADHGPVDLQVCEAAQPGHGGDDGRHVGDLVLGQMAGLGSGVGDELLALAIVELLRDRKGLVGGPAPALAAGLLQRRQVEQARRRLPAMLDRHGEWAGVLGGGLGDGFGHGAIPDAGLGRRGMAHEEGAILDLGRGHDLEIVLDAEVADLDLAQADDGQRGRLHPADADDALDAAGKQRPRRRAGQRQVEDLVGLLPRDGGLVERAQLAVGFELVEGLSQRLGVLSGEQGALRRCRDSAGARGSPGRSAGPRGRSRWRGSPDRNASAPQRSPSAWRACCPRSPTSWGRDRPASAARTPSFSTRPRPHGARPIAAGVPRPAGSARTGRRAPRADHGPGWSSR